MINFPKSIDPTAPKAKACQQFFDLAFQQIVAQIVLQQMYSNKPKFSKSQEKSVSSKIEQQEQSHCSRGEQHGSLSGPSVSQISELIKVFKEFLNTNKQLTDTLKKQERSFDHQDLQPRDRKVVIALPADLGQLSPSSLENYITELCNTVWSRAFYYFSNNQLSYQYTKIYSSQQVLQNLVRLSEKFYLKPFHLSIINSHIQNDVLGYMLQKYPMTLDHEINKNVNSAIKEIDKSGELVNDYLYNSSINFVLRETGEYNDLIMRSVNEVLTKIECRVRNRTIYEKFEHKMEQLFQAVSDEDWMKEKDENKSEIEEIDSYQRLYGINSIKESGLEDTQFRRENMSARIKEREKQKYKERVQAYTSYKIGRKLPESMRLFSTEEIASHNIKIENPQTLRILMKWCEQLERKFKTPSYYEQYVENLKLQNGKSVCLVLDDIKICLDQLMVEERLRIEKQISELSKNNYYLQSELLMRDLFIKGNNSVQRYEKIAANYSIDMVNNLHSYIISYLNRLIHGLLTVANKFSQLPEVSHMELPSKVNLITFQIFDMIRCKCDSGEKETIRLYNEILKLCEGENAKLVRVINRMKRGTHDILINIRYREVLCEIQLGVTNNKNQFIEYSNRFNHYLYQLKRSPFGPLTELCSIWKSLDVKFSIYKSLPCKSHSLSRESRVICSNHYSYEIYNKPFICSSCNSHFYQCYYIKPHLKCKICEYWICAKCQIENSDCKSLLNAAYKNEEIIHKCSKVQSKSNTIPQYGICIYIESQEILVEPFRKVELKNSSKIFGIKNKHLYEIFDISSDDKKACFHEQYVIFEVKSTFGKKHIKIDDQRVRQYLIEEKIKRAFKNNKEKICLNYSSIINHELDRLIEFAPRDQRPNIKKIELIGNNLESLASIADNFPAIKILEVSKNNLKEFDGILRLTELEKLYFNDNGLAQFPTQIGQLQNLKELSLCENRLKAFPDKMKNHTLRALMLSHNCIEEIPIFIQDMTLMVQLNLKNNRIKEIPPFVGHLTKLEVLELQNNEIEAIAQDITHLENLQSLNLSFNNIQQLPHLSSLKSLTRLQVRNNRLTQLPDLSDMEKLSTIDCSNNLLAKAPNIEMAKIAHLNLSYNHITAFPDIQHPISTLKVLMLGHNKLKTVPNLEFIDNLEELYLNDNEICAVYPLYKLQKLQVLSLQRNKVKYFESVRLEKLKQLRLTQNELEQFNRMEFALIEELDLSHNRIREFQNNIMPVLRKVNLNNNRLHAIKLTNYPRLRYAYVSHNVLVTLPEVSDRNQLKTICLDNNCITALAGNILRSQSLSHLNLAFNEIKHIPEDLQRVVNLQDRALELSRNPIQSVDCWDFILRKGTKSTVEHLENIKPKLDNRYSTQTI